MIPNPTGCCDEECWCESGKPATLNVTLENVSGCACLDGAQGIITSPGPGYGWSGTMDLPDCMYSASVNMFCSTEGGAYQLDGDWSALESGHTCNPLRIEFNNVAGFCGHVNVIVTEA